MSGRSHLRVVRTAEEEAHLEPPSPGENQSMKASHATWKFDLLSTVAGDPLTDPFCVVVVLAYSHFCGPAKRTAYLSEIDLRVRTGVVPRALQRAKKRLAALGYMTAVGKTSAGIVIYRLDNPRKDLVAEHRTFATETMKEKDAFRRDEERRRRKMRGCSSAALKNDEGDAHQHPTGPAHQHPNTVENSVERSGSGEERVHRPDPWGVYEATLRPLDDINRVKAMNDKIDADRNRDLNRGGLRGTFARWDFRNGLAWNEYQPIVQTLEGLTVIGRTADEIASDVANRLTAEGVEFTRDVPLPKSAKVDFVIGKIGIVIETGGSGMGTTKRLQALDPENRLIGFVVIGESGLKGRHPTIRPMTTIEA